MTKFSQFRHACRTAVFFTFCLGAELASAVGTAPELPDPGKPRNCRWWDILFAKHVKEKFVAAVPARDVLAFGDSSSPAAVAKLRAIIDRLTSIGAATRYPHPCIVESTASGYQSKCVNDAHRKSQNR